MGNIIDIYRVVVIYVCTLVGVLFSRDRYSTQTKNKTKQKNQKENIECISLGFSNFFTYKT